jgi:hypothetical protein
MDVSTLMHHLTRLDEASAELVGERRRASSLQEVVKTSADSSFFKNRSRAPSEESLDKQYGIDIPKTAPLLDLEDREIVEERRNVALINPSNFTFVDRDIGLKERDDSPKRDKALIQRWRSSGEDADLEAIYSRNKGFLDQQIWSLSKFRIPKPAIQGAVYNTFKTAVGKWDPDGGSNIRSFYKSHYRQNLHRQIKATAQFARAERGRVSKVERIRQLQENFELERGYIPTAEELKQAANPGELKVQDIKLILKEAKGDLLGSRNLGAEDDIDLERSTMMAIRRVRDYHGSRKQKIINHIWGIDDHKHIASNNVLAKKFGITPSKMSMLKRQFRQDIQEELRNMGL